MIAPISKSKPMRMLMIISVFCVWEMCSGTILSKTSTKNDEFSFTAPSGWQLEKFDEKHYWLRQFGRREPRCSIGVRAENGRSLVSGHDATLTRLHSIIIGPTEPLVHRTELRSRSGLRILKADARWGAYSQPQYRRGFLNQIRCVLYSFRKGESNRIYSLECYPDPHGGTFFDQALDEMAKSVRF
jgi:hypothetical protein